MLLKQLTISAFGPYQDVVTISFDDFVNAGIFLITGPTGAGKTMLFDAIMFALYGTTSGSERQATQLRCVQANETTKTYVELEFILHNQTFHIHRSPSYYVQNRKTPRLPNAILTLPSGEIVEGIKEVHQKMIAILGIDEKQFKQIAMIAQGEFTKLIYASSDEREKVLRNLFNTQKYRDLEEQLKEQTKVYKDEYDILFKQRSLLLQKLSVDTEDSDIHETFKEKQKETNRLEETSHMYQKRYHQINQELQYIKANNSRIESLKEITEHLLSLENQKNDYSILLQNIQRIKTVTSLQPMYEKKQLLTFQTKQASEELAQIEGRLSAIHETYGALEKQYVMLPNKEEKKQHLQQQYQSLLQTKDVYGRWLEDTKKQNEIEKTLQQIEQDIQEIEKQKRYIEKKLEKDIQSISMIEVLKQDFLIKQQEYEMLHQRKTQLHDLNALYNRSIQEEDRRFALEETYKSIEKEYDLLKANCEQLERLYQYEQAGMLATSLRKGEPCPVCGSLDHPFPANLHKDTFDHEYYAIVKEKLSIMSEKKNNAYQEVLLKKQELQLIQTRLLEKASEIGITEELSKQLFIVELSTIQRNEKAMKKSYLSMQDEISYLEKLKKTVSYNQKDVERWQLEIENLQEQQKEQLTKKNQLEGIVSTYTLDKSITLEQIEDDIASLQQQIDTLENQIYTIQSEYIKTKEDILTLESTKQALSKQIDRLEQEYNAIQNTFDVALKKQSLTVEQFMWGLEHMKQLDSYEQKYQQYQTELTSLKHQKVALEKEVGKNKKRSTAEIEEQLEDISIKQKEVEKQLVEHKTEVMKYQQLIDDMEKIDKAIASMQKQYQQYAHLADITSGKNNYRVSFERYVLAAYFEKVLLYANEILMKMSQGRYQLHRRDHRSKGNAKQGLELDVLDLENGILRDVKTLSGGESFKAALSLALGMSQMIQSYAGGMELQTLFIDEGFGTLDSQSLDQAIVCLMELQQDNKVIGIISHVNELKERIDHKIMVVRNYQKSSIYIEEN